jgi:uncharacterized membrane protein YphA (DoxX/SURF4 family)
MSMNVVLWVLQILLAMAFAAAGTAKLTQPRDRLRQSMPFVEDFSDQAVKLIGVAEVLGAIGLILPAAIGIATWLTPIAAACLAVVMVLATLTHIRRRESVGPTVVLFALAAFVAIERFGPQSS